MSNTISTLISDPDPIGTQLRAAVARLDAEMPEAVEGWTAFRSAGAIVRAEFRRFSSSTVLENDHGN